MAVLNSTAILSCNYGGSGGQLIPPTPTPPPFTSVPTVRVSQASTLAANCNGAPQTGTLYLNAEVEPHMAINPANPANFVGAWQQDRWSNGGAQGLMLAASFDSGRTWSLTSAPFSRCTGGNVTNGGDFQRVTDPWVAISPDGSAYASALAFSGGTLVPGSTSAILVARSPDGGLTWGNPVALIQDGDQFFNDKETITADPADARFVYAVWDRLTIAQAGPLWFARTINGGASWETARSIFDPGAGRQTIGSQIVVLPGGRLINVFTDLAVNGQSATIRAIRSADRGDTWSAPVTVAQLMALGATSPDDGTPIRDGSVVPAVAVDGVGVVYVVWQDSRFSAGLRDGIALARSLDGGLTWSVPVQVNADDATTAFTPAVHVRADGAIGVTYYDFRNNTPDPAALLTDYWMATSTDAISWTESHLSGPFDLDRAPDAGGFFLGDYQALGSVGTDFLPFFVQTTLTGTGNRTDVFIGFRRTTPVSGRALEPTRSHESVSREPERVSDEWQTRLRENLKREQARRFVVSGLQRR